MVCSLKFGHFSIMLCCPALVLSEDKGSSEAARCALLAFMILSVLWCTALVLSADKGSSEAAG